MIASINASSSVDASPQLFMNVDSGERLATPVPLKTAVSKTALPLSAIEQMVLAAIGRDPILQDGVIGAVGGQPGEILGSITSLELKGLIRRLPGAMVVRAGAG